MKNILRILTLIFISVTFHPHVAKATYDPNVGVWLSRDPLEESGGPNLKAYCNNNPISYTDPFGLMRELTQAEVGYLPLPKGYYPYFYAEKWWEPPFTTLLNIGSMAENNVANGLHAVGMIVSYADETVGDVSYPVLGVRDPLTALGPVGMEMSEGVTLLKQFTQIKRMAKVEAVFFERTCEAQSKTGNTAHLRLYDEFEANRISANSGSKNYWEYIPSPTERTSAAFNVVVGPEKFTKGGQPVGTIFDSMKPKLLEIKGGESMLDSSYQLRLQTFYALKNDLKLTLETTRPLNPQFEDYAKRWGVIVIKIDQQK